MRKKILYWGLIIVLIILIAYPSASSYFESIYMYSPNQACTTLTALNTDYDTTSSETNNSADQTTSGYSRCELIWTLAVTGTPTGPIQPLFYSKNGSNYFLMENGFLRSYPKGSSGAGSYSVQYTCPASGTHRISITASGLTASTNYYTVTNAALCLSNP